MIGSYQVSSRDHLKDTESTPVLTHVALLLWAHVGTRSPDHFSREQVWLPPTSSLWHHNTSHNSLQTNRHSSGPSVNSSRIWVYNVMILLNISQLNIQMSVFWWSTENVKVRAAMRYCENKETVWSSLDIILHLPEEKPASTAMNWMSEEWQTVRERPSNNIQTGLWNLSGEEPSKLLEN